mmetsp:Transcript_1723/g.2402  ORF Transcript_1723/g.2402 Transcript_1723/m.2402 type:complete len:126 (-) Transcript_1723:183-560(-)
MIRIRRMATRFLVDDFPLSLTFLRSILTRAGACAITFHDWVLCSFLLTGFPNNIYHALFFVQHTEPWFCLIFEIESWDLVAAWMFTRDDAYIDHALKLMRAAEPSGTEPNEVKNGPLGTLRLLAN